MVEINEFTHHTISVVETAHALRAVFVEDVQFLVILNFNGCALPSKYCQILTLKKEHSFHLRKLSSEYFSLALYHSEPQKVRNLINSEFFLRFEFKLERFAVLDLLGVDGSILIVDHLF